MTNKINKGLRHPSKNEFHGSRTNTCPADHLEASSAPSATPAATIRRSTKGTMATYEATDETNEFVNTCSKRPRSLNCEVVSIAGWPNSTDENKDVSGSFTATAVVEPMVPANDWLSNFLKELDEEQTTAAEVANSDEPTDKATGLGSLEVLTAMDASSCPTTLKPSTALSEQAKKVKRTREKLRRDSLNSRYQQLSAVLELCESKKSDKEELVSAATDLIKRLRAEHVRLANTIMRFQDEKSQKADLLRALAMEREQLVKEKAQLLEEKLHVEGQLQRFLVSMPFASPMDDMGSTKSTSGVPAWTMPAPFAPANEEEDLTLRPPVA